jgi:hypothetical protein
MHLPVDDNAPPLLFEKLYGRAALALRAAAYHDGSRLFVPAVKLSAVSLMSTRYARCVLRSLAAYPRWSWRSEALAALGLFLLAFAVRSLHAVDLAPVMESRNQPGVRMATRYDGAADAILRGEGVLFPDHKDPRDTGLLARPPGYPLFLATVYTLVGRTFYAVGMVQDVADSLAVSVLFLLAARVVSARVGLLAALFMAVGHYSAYYSNFITPDTLCVLPILLALLLLAPVRAGRLRNPLRYVACGLLLGVSCWLRPNSLVLGPFLAAAIPVLYGFGRAQLLRAASLALSCLLVVAPITLRNLRVYGAFVPISINMGIVLWEGIADSGGEAYGARGRDFEVAWQESQEHNDARYAEWWASPDGIARDRERIRKSLEVIRAHPGWFFWAAVRRAFQMVGYAFDDPPTLLRSPKEVPPDARSGALTLGERLAWSRGGLGLAQGILKTVLPASIAVGFLGLLLASPRRALFLGLVPLTVLLFQSPLHFEFRATLPMHVLLLVFSASGLVLLVSVLLRPLRDAG